MQRGQVNLWKKSVPSKPVILFLEIYAEKICENFFVEHKEPISTL